MGKIISFETLLKIFRIYDIRTQRKLKGVNDPVFLRISRKFKVKKETIYAKLQKNWKLIWKWQPYIALVECNRHRIVSILD